MRPRHGFWPRLAVCSLLVVASAGCATVARLDLLGRRVAFEDAQRSYTRLVRWSEFARASEYVDPEVRDAYLSHAERLAFVRFTDYEVQSSDFEIGRSEATVRVTYRAYRTTEALETTFQEEQAWYRDPESGSWRVRPHLVERRLSLVRPGR